MPRSYAHIQKYEKEILQLKEEGFSQREIGNQLGFSKEQIKEFLKRYRRNESKIQSGIPIRKKGRPTKEHINSEDLSTIIKYKDKQIKALEMENELLRDFLSLTGRK